MEELKLSNLQKITHIKKLLELIINKLEKISKPPFS